MWARQLRFKIVREVLYEGNPGLKQLWPELFVAALVYLLADAVNDTPPGHAPTTSGGVVSDNLPSGFPGAVG